ncbi:NAD/NADP-dependent indole-3-acetaldehyde reductase [Psilocybe cubensis]|uniref:NAD/NADP-dependent indole-3-acetaldehyde reductase n=2 Tax=Psilocybe cubensis TaxID=181762 RepID=A0ACB8GTH9_PSICU|nr:NAD/NADP-dependent indole-3-acetaldehyde reductase [Psilocybe cubensis]KAH9478295.1 NAD/NADP-dependent indole-3-acetaldehyde reductase [Psilocybe cubensis]
MTIPPIESFPLLDGTSIPWLAWGNGTGGARRNAVECGHLALAGGVRHIDTAQLYENERETGEAIRLAGLKREDVYVTSKISCTENDTPLPLSAVPASIQASLDRLGSIPDLYLIHNPFVARPGELKALWHVLEDFKEQGKLKSIGVSNFRPQDLEEILEGARYTPVVNQIEYHPYTLAHLQPLLDLHARHGIVTASYGTLTPLLRHPSGGGPLAPILQRIASRLSDALGKQVEKSTVLMLWARARGVVVVTASGNAERVKKLGEIASLPPGLLTEKEVEEITRVGRGVHFRYYTEHMEKDFPVPDLPRE